MRERHKNSRMSYTNRGADIPMDKLDVAFQPHRNMHRGGEGEEEFGGEREESEDRKSDKDKKSAGKLPGMLDANAYATKKTIAQGMLDVALLTANASQLKYLLQVGTAHEFYHLMLSLISISIILQIVVGLLFIVIGYLNLNEEKDQRAANILNNIITIAIFLIAAVNIVISSFGMKESDKLYTPLQR